MSLDESRVIYQGRVIRLNVDKVTLPNGKQTELEMVHHPGAAAVVPLDDRGDVLLVRQYRHAVGGYIFEVPAGKLDPGETPIECAHRELVEEVGVAALELQPLASILTTPGFSDEVIHLFLGLQLQSAQQALEPDEVLTVERFSFERVIEMCSEGEIRDAKSICAILLAQAHLNR